MRFKYFGTIFENSAWSGFEDKLNANNIKKKETSAVKSNVIPHEETNEWNFKLKEMVKKLLEKIAIIVDSTIFYSSALLGFVDK